MDIQKGATDRSFTLRIFDSTTFLPKTDVVYNSSGIDLWYRREGGAVVSITEASLAAVDSAHTDGGFIHLGAGYYRLDAPDAAFATGANKVMAGGVCTGCIIVGQEVRLVNYNPEDAVRLGLTALPNANADAAGGLPISDAGGLDLDAKLAHTEEVTAARMGALTDWIDGGRLDLLLDALLARLTETRAGYLDYLASGTYGLNALLTAINTRLATSGYTAPDNANIGNIYSIVNSGTYGLSALRTLLVTTGIALTAAERTAIANEVEAQIIDETDSEKVLTAITDKIASVNPSLAGLTLAAIASQVRTELATELARLDAAVSTRLASSGYTVPDNTNIGNIHTIISSAAHGNAALKTLIDAVKALTDKLETAMTADGAAYKFTANALEESPAGGSGGDATAENQATIITHLTDIKGAGFTSSDALNSIRDAIDTITGEGAGSSIVTLTIHDADGNNVLDAAVEMWDSAGTTFVERKISNSSGQAVFNRNDGTYTVKVIKAGYTFANAIVTVSGNTSQTITGSNYGVGTAPAANMCRVWVEFHAPDNVDTITATADVPLYTDGSNNMWAGTYDGVYDSVTESLYWDVPQAATKVVLKIRETGTSKTIPLIPSVTSYELDGLI